MLFSTTFALLEQFIHRAHKAPVNTCDTHISLAQVNNWTLNDKIISRYASAINDKMKNNKLIRLLWLQHGTLFSCISINSRLKRSFYQVLLYHQLNQCLALPGSVALFSFTSNSHSRIIHLTHLWIQKCLFAKLENRYQSNEKPLAFHWMSALNKKRRSAKDNICDEFHLIISNRNSKAGRNCVKRSPHKSLLLPAHTSRMHNSRHIINFRWANLSTCTLILFMMWTKSANRRLSIQLRCTSGLEKI